MKATGGGEVRQKIGDFPSWDLQHPKRPQWRPRFSVAQDGPGKRSPGPPVRGQYHRWDICVVFRRIFNRCVRCSKLPPQGCGTVLQRVFVLRCGSPPEARPGRHQLSAGDGRRRWHVVRCYLAPRDASTLESVILAIRQQPRGKELLVTVDFNTDMEFSDGHKRKKEISAVMVT